jgi:GAF domain-containing protein/HAMP domain-containing protein
VIGLPFWSLWLAVGLGAGVLGGILWLSAARSERALSHLVAYVRSVAAGEPAEQPQVVPTSVVPNRGLWGHSDRWHELLRALDELGRQLRDADEMQRQLEADCGIEVAQLARFLETARRTGQIAATSTSEQSLLQGVVDEIGLLRPRYHVGLYLLEEDEAWAVLRGEACPQDGETWMLWRRVAVGDGTTVGQCLASAEVRVWPDAADATVRAERVFQSGTRSDLAVPLRAHERVLGALAVSSDRVEVFEGSFIAAMQTIAVQTACALAYMRLSLGTRSSLPGGRNGRATTEEAWRELLRTRSNWGYRYSNGQVERLSGDWLPEMREALVEGHHVQACVAGPSQPPGKVEGALAVPLRVRNQTVGVLWLRKPADGFPSAMSSWTAQEIQFVELLVSQLGDALVGAQLHEAAEDNASKQQVVAELASQMRQTLDVESVLRAAAGEMREALGLPEVVVRLRAPGRAAANDADQPG